MPELIGGDSLVLASSFSSKESSHTALNVFYLAVISIFQAHESLLKSEAKYRFGMVVRHRLCLCLKRLVVLVLILLRLGFGASSVCALCIIRQRYMSC